MTPQLIPTELHWTAGHSLTFHRSPKTRKLPLTFFISNKRSFLFLSEFSVNIALSRDFLFEKCKSFVTMNSNFPSPASEFSLFAMLLPESCRKYTKTIQFLCWNWFFSLTDFQKNYQKFTQFVEWITAWCRCSWKENMNLFFFVKRFRGIAYLFF